MERKNIFIVILSITTIIAACFAIYFYVNPTVVNVETKQDDMVTGDNVQQEVKIEEKIVYKYVPSIENGKCLNARENVSYTVERNVGFEGITASIKDSGKSVLLNVNWNIMKDIYADVKVNDTTEYSITNFSKKVVNVYIEGMGQAVGSEMLIFLMEDGTVEYMPLSESLIKQEFKSYGQIKDVSNIVDVVKGTAYASIDRQPGPGWYTIFAINNEGNYYDIGAIIQNK